MFVLGIAEKEGGIRGKPANIDGQPVAFGLSVALQMEQCGGERLRGRPYRASVGRPW
jgi:hypothetical protein